MSPRRDDTGDHYPVRKPDVSLQLAGLPLLDPHPETERARLEREDTIEARFKLFHADNPHIYELLELHIEAKIANGAKRIGISQLVEEMRYDPDIKTRGIDFKVNNDFRSRYSRLLIQRHPEWARVLGTRELRSA